MSPRKREDEAAEEYDADSMTEGLVGIIGEKPDSPDQKQLQPQIQQSGQEIPVQTQPTVPETPSTDVLEGLMPPPDMDFGDKGTSSKRIADVFKTLIPHTDRLLVYKVSARGRKGLVGEYGAPDLDRSPSIDAFIKEYISPTYGPGDYIVEVRGAEGKLKKNGMVNIPAPVIPQNNSPTLSEILMAQQTMQKEAEQKSGQQFQNMLSMFTMLKEMMPKGAAGASGGDNSMMMMMFLMMMMQQQQKPTGPDPVTQMLLQKFEQMEKDKYGFGSHHFPMLPPLPPLPPPPMDSSSSVAEVIKALVEVIKPINQPQQNNELLAHLIALAAKPDHNSITLKEIMGLLPAFKDMIAPNRDGVATFNDYLEGLMRLDEIRGSRSGEDHSIWAGLAESVANVFRDIKLQQMRLEAISRTGSAGKIQKSISGQHIQSTTQAGMPIPVPPPTEGVERPKRPAPSIPVSFRKFAARMKDAYSKGDEPALVMAFIEGLLHLRENSQEWSPYIEETMTLAAKGEKKKALKYLEVFLFTFAKNKLIPLDVVGATKKTMELNWDMIMEETGLAKVLSDEEEAAESTDTDENAAEDVETDDDEEGDDDEVDPKDIPQEQLNQEKVTVEPEKTEEADVKE